MKRRYLLVFWMMAAIYHHSIAQSGSLEIIYKKVDDIALSMIVVYPDDFDPTQASPAIVFFYGGGWVEGTVEQFKPQARHLAGRGMVAFLVDYRVESRHGTTPFESLKDAKSAIRFIRGNAHLLGVDPYRIAGAGGSAGGQLAAATALIEGFNEESDDLSVSSRPDALVLFNPVLDNGPNGFGFDKIGDEYPSVSPLHNVNPGAPPTIMFLGTKDSLIPVETLQAFKLQMQDAGSHCELILYEDQGHGFFNYHFPVYYNKTLKETERFLMQRGLIKRD